MMVGRIGAQIALLAFAAAICVGIVSGNTPTTVLVRALLVMVGALFVGQFAAWTCKLILRDHLRCEKIAIDRRHVKEMETLKATEPSAAEEGVVEASAEAG